MKTLKTGDKIVFGSYPQKANPSDGKEPIEWRVLAVDDDKSLLFSEKILDCKPYNDVLKDVTWETCTLRKWLNDEFYNAAFDTKEQEKIMLNTVTNKKSELEETCDKDSSNFLGIKPQTGSNNTSDKIFLLSEKEANKSEYGLFCDLESDLFYEDEDANDVGDDDFDEEGNLKDIHNEPCKCNTSNHNRYYHAIRAAIATEFAVNQGLEVVHEESVLGYGCCLEYIVYPLQKVELDYGFWWLRTPGPIPNYAHYVSYDGLDFDGLFMSGKVVSEKIGVRPALWIHL